MVWFSVISCKPPSEFTSVCILSPQVTSHVTGHHNCFYKKLTQSSFRVGLIFWLLCVQAPPTSPLCCVHPTIPCNKVTTTIAKLTYGLVFKVRLVSPLPCLLFLLDFTSMCTWSLSAKIDHHYLVMWKIHIWYSRDSALIFKPHFGSHYSTLPPRKLGHSDLILLKSILGMSCISIHQCLNSLLLLHCFLFYFQDIYIIYQVITTWCCL